MFTPKYEITHALLENIKRIYSLVQILNQRNYSASGVTKLGRNGVPAKASLKAASALTPFLRAVDR